MNRIRFRSGQQQLIRVRVDADSIISAGDLVFLDGNFAVSAEDFDWNVTLALTQADFAAQFLGIAQEPSDAGEDDPISVDISSHSVYEFDVASGTYEVGDPLGPDEDSSTLMAQQLEAALAANSIARAAEYKAAASTTLKVTFASAYQTGSANVNAQVG